MTDLVERLRMAGRNGNPDAREAVDEIERLRAAIAAEREACANIARVMALEHADASGEDDYAAQVCRDIAAAIRSRSKEET